MSNEGKNFLKTVTIAFLFFFLGVISTLALQSCSSSRWTSFIGLGKPNTSNQSKGLSRNKSFFDQFFGKENSSEDDMWGHMQDIQEKMEKEMQESFHGLGTGLNMADGNLSIEEREDEKYLYYELKIDNIDKQSLNVDVKDGMVSISGKYSDGNISSQYHQSFSVPDNVDWQKVEIENKDKTLVLKFPKL